MKKRDVAILFGLLVFVIHMAIVAEDVQAILQDPNEANKPGEILKTAIDMTRYFG